MLFDGGSMQVSGSDQITCYYSSVDPSTPMAFLEQIAEAVEGQGLVHARLTMNPAFVDNTYGSNAIGWASDAIEAQASTEEFANLAIPESYRGAHVLQNGDILRCGEYQIVAIVEHFLEVFCANPCARLSKICSRSRCSSILRNRAVCLPRNLQVAPKIALA